MDTTLVWRFFLFTPPKNETGGRSNRRETPTPQPKATHRGPVDPQEIARDLVVRIQHGDTVAFATMFRTQYPALVRALTYYAESIDVAEDIAQEVFLQVWEGRAAIDSERSLRSYLYMLGRNKVLNMRKHSSVVHRHAEQSLEDAGISSFAAPSADQTLLADELTEWVAQQVALLSPRQREIYHLSRDEGLTAGQIAEILGIAPQTVYVQLGRIVRALYPKFEAWLKDLP
jgi:RNA polymerase sigma-70 factor (ECF subfamily)